MLLTLKEEKLSLISLCGLALDQTEASFQFCGLTAQDAMLLAPEIAVRPLLTNLNLYHNSLLGDDGIDAICKAIQRSKETKLASLNISYTNVGSAGIQSVASLLRVTPSMTFVDVSENAVGDEGMRIIGAALLSSTTSKLGAIKCDAFDLPVGATSLDFSTKRISSAAGTLLAGVVKGNASVTSVRAFGNRRSSGG